MPVFLESYNILQTLFCFFPWRGSPSLDRYTNLPQNSALLAQPSRGDIYSFNAGADRAAEEAAGGQAEVPLTTDRVPPGVSVLARTRDANPAVGGGWRRLTAVQLPGAVLCGGAVLLARLRALLVAAGRVEVDAGGLADVGGVVGHECCLVLNPCQSQRKVLGFMVYALGFRVQGWSGRAGILPFRPVAARV